MRVYHARDDRRAHLRADCVGVVNPHGACVPMTRTRRFAWCRLCGPRGANGWALGRAAHARVIEMEWDPATGYLPAPFYRGDYVGPVEFP